MVLIFFPFFFLSSGSSSSYCFPIFSFSYILRAYWLSLSSRVTFCGRFMTSFLSLTYLPQQFVTRRGGIHCQYNSFLTAL